MQDASDGPNGGWLTPALGQAIGRQVSAYLGAPWRITHTYDRTDYASHPAAVLSDGSFAVFVKLGQGPVAEARFRTELAGLRLLHERTGVLAPAGIDVVECEDGTMLIMEAVQEIERSPDFWRQMGRALAQIHSAKAEQFGLDTPCYWGDLYQDNTPGDDWPVFFWERRLAPRLKAAVDSGNLPVEFAIQIEHIGARLPELCGPSVAPALLHGDAHQNNCLCTPQGPVFIDPSVYYGHPEMDLAYVDFFEPLPDEVFRGYSERAPLDPGFAARRPLWRMPALLAMIEGGLLQYFDELDEAVRRFR